MKNYYIYIRDNYIYNQKTGIEPCTILHIFKYLPKKKL